MKRKTWLLISAVIALIFSLLMMLQPNGFTAGISIQSPTPAVNAWAQFLGTNLFAIGWINFFARNSPWSPAVRGILTGNIILHLLALVFDGYAYTQNVISLQGVVQGAVVHIVFIIGFGFYAFKPQITEVHAAPGH